MTAYRDEHLTPEQFVDLLEGAPVEASARGHVEACARCRAELSELGETLSALEAEHDVELTEPAPPAAEMPSGARRRVGWIVAASVAAVVIAGLALRGLVPLPSSGPDEMAGELLPPIESDAEFQLLLSVSAGEMRGVEVAEGGDGLETLDSSVLTPAQRQRLVERLAEEMRSSS